MIEAGFKYENVYLQTIDREVISIYYLTCIYLVIKRECWIKGKKMYPYTNYTLIKYSVSVLVSLQLQILNLCNFSPKIWIFLTNNKIYILSSFLKSICCFTFWAFAIVSLQFFIMSRRKLSNYISCFGIEQSFYKF